MKKNIVALLPIKRNSVRIPDKNFRLFNGKPLFEWVLQTLLNCAQVSKVIINTDDIDKLKSYPITENEKVVFRHRKDDLCGDDVSMNRVLEDDIKNVSADLYLMTHATNPLLSVAAIDEAISTLMASPQHDSLFSVNVHQTRLYEADGTPLNHDPSNLLKTQDLPPLYEENSCIYLFTAPSFAATGARIGVTPMMYPLSKIEAMDIDTPEDWEMAQALHKAWVVDRQ